MRARPQIVFRLRVCCGADCARKFAVCCSCDRGQLFYAEHWKAATTASQLGIHPDTVGYVPEIALFDGGRRLGPWIGDPHLDFMREERNIVLSEWSEASPGASCLIALADRLTHHAGVTVLEGTSHRLRESELEAARRRKKK